MGPEAGERLPPDSKGPPCHPRSLPRRRRGTLSSATFPGSTSTLRAQMQFRSSGAGLHHRRDGRGDSKGSQRHWLMLLDRWGESGERQREQRVSGHSSGQSVQAQANTRQHYLDEEGLRHRTNEHENETPRTNRHQHRGSSKAVRRGDSVGGSIPARLRK